VIFWTFNNYGMVGVLKPTKTNR